MKPKINLEKFICSYVKWNNIQDALKDQGLKCWNGEIVEIESEDERMKKEILDLVSISGNGNQFEEIKDWLEKQGKQKPFDYETATIIQKDFAPKEVTCTQEVETGNGNIKALVTQKYPAESLGISPEKYNEIVNECIYGQSTDKIKPKFKVGDWVKVSTIKGDRVVQIASVEYFKNGYPSYTTTEGRWFGNGTKARLLTDKDMETITLPKSKFITYKDKEKQVEKKPVKNIVEIWKDMRLEVYQQASGNRHEPNYSDDNTKMFSLNDIDEIIEKMGEQKLINKVEPKFKVGDWVVSKTSNLVYHVDSILLPQSKCYYLSHDGGVVIVSFTDEQNYHLWTIADAKDGDVLTTQGSVFIFKHLDKTGRSLCKSYCEVIGNSGLGLGFEFSINGVCPATKEQCDLLFAKMKEAGYEWDAEKKELKNIEPNLSNSPEIGKNDTLSDLLHKMPSCITVDGIDYHFVLKKTIAYMAYYEGEGEGGGKVIFWMAGDPIDLLTTMLEKLKNEGLL